MAKRFLLFEDCHQKAVISVILFLSANVVGQQEAFTTVSKSSYSTAGHVEVAFEKSKKRSYVERQSLVMVDREALFGDSVSMTFFPDRKDLVIFNSTKVIEGYGPSFPKTMRTGHIKGNATSSVIVFIRNNGTVSGRIAFRGKVYTIDPISRDNEAHLIIEYNPRKMPYTCQSLVVQDDIHNKR